MTECSTCAKGYTGRFVAGRTPGTFACAACGNEYALPKPTDSQCICGHSAGTHVDVCHGDSGSCTCTAFTSMRDATRKMTILEFKVLRAAALSDDGSLAVTGDAVTAARRCARRGLGTYYEWFDQRTFKITPSGRAALAESEGK